MDDRNNKSNELLNRVKVAEEKVELVQRKAYRPHFHMVPPVGWLNDPNGLCFFKGWYHAFFQYSPEEVNGGLKFWGHYRSKDMCNWEYLGTPILPDIEEDRDGAYSGCAYVEDGVMEIFYTGNVKEPGDYDYITAGRGANVIYMSSEDGIHFENKRVLLTNADYPAECSCHVRDPKVFKVQDKYYMVLGARTKEDKGIILLYQSDDKLNWSFFRIITTQESFGYMWECPDYFEMQDVYFLMCCPQGVEQQDDNYQNIYQSGYFRYQNSLQLGEFTEWDRGFDFYAPQTFLDDQGRRIMIGWAGVPDAEYGNLEAIEEGWHHCLTMPREIVMEDGIVKQHPVKEIDNVFSKHEVTKQQQFVIDSTICKVEIEIAENTSDELCGFRVENDLEFTYEDHMVCLQFLNDTGCGRTERKARISKLKKIAIYMDASIMEIFVNEGEMVFTTRYYPTKKEQLEFILLGHGKYHTTEIWL